MGAAMAKRGVLKTVSMDDGSEGFVLSPRWARALDLYLSASGVLIDDQRVILVRDTGKPTAFRLLAAGEPASDAAWAATLAGGGWDLAIALRPGARDESARRLLNWLRGAGVACDLLRVGNPVAGHEMQAWAAAMLPDDG